MAFIGTPLDTRNTFQSLVGKRFNGDGSTTAFTLDVAPSSTLDIEVFVGNVRQDPNSAYTLSGTTLTFTGAPPSGTNNIYVVHQAKSVGTIDPPATISSEQAFSAGIDVNGTEIKLDADADTSITADTDDQIDFKVGGTDVVTLTNSNLVLKGTTPTITIGDAGAEDTKIQFDGNAQDFYIGLDDSGDEFQIGRGSTLGAGREFSIGASGPVFNEDSDTHDFRIESDDNTHAFFVHGAADRINMFNSISSDPNDNTNDEFGLFMSNNGATTLNTNGDAFNVNRQNSDGSVIGIRQEGQGEGDISVSGSTVAYNTFCGAHWSRLADNSKPTILRGTVIESIGTMMNWYNLDVKDENNNTIAKKSIGLPNGKSVGDSHTIVDNGITYTGIISKEDNEQLPKCKISDTADSKAVYGVFMRWDDTDDGLDGDVNDMNVAALGAFVIRVHKDQTVSIGDYLVSNGDGTAKKQTDDILRASTIAKVTSTTKTHEYADDSYCVPCVLHCG
jgi:hypothetical protein